MIAIITVNTAFRLRLSLDFASARPPDVFLMNYREYGIFAEKGQLETLGSYLAQSSTIHADDFYPQALAVFTNNHVLDWGRSGLAETLATLRRAGLRTAGAGSDEAAAAAPAVPAATPAEIAARFRATVDLRAARRASRPSPSFTRPLANPPLGIVEPAGTEGRMFHPFFKGFQGVF